MASNIFGRYIWLVDLLKAKGKLTFSEINQHWQNSGLGYGEDIPLRTFHNHRTAIADIFGIDICCESRGRNSFYYIEDVESLDGDRFRKWLLDSYAVINQITVDKSLHGKISFEPIPSGNKYLMDCTNAIRQRVVIEIDYVSYADKGNSTKRRLKPYGLKLFHQRWYLIAFDCILDDIRTFSLDRIKDLVLTEETFQPPSIFDIDEYFHDYAGIIYDEKIKLDTIRIKAYGYARDYLKSLPLHRSQREVEYGEHYTMLEYRLHPTYDFMIMLLQQGSQIEVVSPKYFRLQMRDLLEEMSNRYK